MDSVIVIGGDISLVNEPIDGAVDISINIEGSPDLFMPIIPDPYTGSYEFTASDTTQTINVEGMTMLHDIVIDPVPSNYGLITWNGSTLMVS